MKHETWRVVRLMLLQAALAVVMLTAAMLPGVPTWLRVIDAACVVINCVGMCLGALVLGSRWERGDL